MCVTLSAVWTHSSTAHSSHDIVRRARSVHSWPFTVLSLLQNSMPAVMTMLADHAAQQLLDFNQKLDINLLDNVVNCLYHGVGPQVRWFPPKSRINSNFAQNGPQSGLSAHIPPLKCTEMTVWTLKFPLSLCVTAKNGTGSVDTLKRASRRLDQSGYHLGVLSKHEHQSKRAILQKVQGVIHLVLLWGRFLNKGHIAWSRIDSVLYRVITIWKDSSVYSWHI